MGVSVAPVPPERAGELLTAMGGSFGFDPDAGDVERFRKVFDWDRIRAAHDGEAIVGTVGAHSLDLTVPGATMACGGTTIVSVLPTHRRRGILRMMLDSHLEDVREREEPIAGLWASDSAIYGRFGYGCAAQSARLEIPRDHSRFHRLAPDPAPVRLVDAEEAHALLPPHYDRVRREIPGFFGRSDVWWENRRFRDEKADRDGATAYRYAVAEVAGEVTGYVQYRFKEDWSDGHGEGEVRVRELVGSDPAAWAGLWRFLLDHDLTTTVSAANRSVEDPLLELLEGRRRASMKVTDSLWIRVMDPSAALEGRSYSAPVSTVLALHDPIDASVTTWRLELSPEGSEVTRTSAEASITMDVEDLGACFMGWSRFRSLAGSGRVEGDYSALAALDRAFGWSPLPWCNEVF